MVFAFLMPLFTGLISGYIFQKSTDEIGYLAGVAAVISFVMSLILAPWEIQFLLLVVVLVSTHKLLQQNESRIKLQSDRDRILVSQQQQIEVPCKYRGANYEPHDTVTEVTEGEVVGKYRGSPWRSHQVNLE
jgi:membrane protein implicated in regulation of membrane protease activity